MHCKKAVDARSYSHEMLETLRRDAVLRVEQGESPEAVAQGLGINRRTIYRWLAAYHYGGDDALAAKPIPGAPPKLDAKQIARLVRLIKDRTPQHYKFEYALWTLAIIRELIDRVFGVRLSEVSVSRLMKRLGFSPQRPLYRELQLHGKRPRRACLPCVRKPSGRLRRVSHCESRRRSPHLEIPKRATSGQAAAGDGRNTCFHSALAQPSSAQASRS